MTLLLVTDSADGSTAPYRDWSLCVPLFLAYLMSACNFASTWLQQDGKKRKALVVKAWMAPICTIPMACSRCSDVSHSIPVIEIVFFTVEL